MSETPPLPEQRRIPRRRILTGTAAVGLVGAFCAGVKTKVWRILQGEVDARDLTQWTAAMRESSIIVPPSPDKKLLKIILRTPEDHAKFIKLLESSAFDQSFFEGWDIAITKTTGAMRVPELNFEQERLLGKRFSRVIINNSGNESPADLPHGNEYGLGTVAGATGVGLAAGVGLHALWQRKKRVAAQAEVLAHPELIISLDERRAFLDFLEKYPDTLFGFKNGSVINIWMFNPATDNINLNCFPSLQLANLGGYPGDAYICDVTNLRFLTNLIAHLGRIKGLETLPSLKGLYATRTCVDLAVLSPNITLSLDQPFRERPSIKLSDLGPEKDKYKYNHGKIELKDGTEDFSAPPASAPTPPTSAPATGSPPPRPSPPAGGPSRTGPASASTRTPPVTSRPPTPLGTPTAMPRSTAVPGKPASTPNKMPGPNDPIVITGFLGNLGRGARNLVRHRGARKKTAEAIRKIPDLEPQEKTALLQLTKIDPTLTITQNATAGTYDLKSNYADPMNLTMLQHVQKIQLLHAHEVHVRNLAALTHLSAPQARVFGFASCPNRHRLSCHTPMDPLENLKGVTIKVHGNPNWGLVRDGRIDYSTTQS